MVTEIYVGTSGWLYDWNIAGNLDWYIKFSGLNAVELNASFYRFPFRNQVIGWARKGKNFRWSIKVHRSITHYRKLSSSSLNTWKKFRALFEPLENIRVLDFFLFQMPPTYTKTKQNIEKLKNFVESSEIEPRKIAVEFRHKSWFVEDTVKIAEELGIVLVSIDSPIGTWIRSAKDTIYLRMHGRSAWYAHEYSEEELSEIVEKILKFNPKRIYVFFNNNHWMLENARTLLGMLREELR